jgi:hypothetical protein
MSWSRPLPKTIVLRDGRELKTLSDARALILALPKDQQGNPYWEYASELLTAAAQGDRQYMKGCVDHLKRVLRADGLI